MNISFMLTLKNRKLVFKFSRSLFC